MLMISSDLPEVLGMSDRIAVMRGGTIDCHRFQVELTELTSWRPRSLRRKEDPHHDLRRNAGCVRDSRT